MLESVYSSEYPALYSFYRHQLLDDCVPFWLEHSLDREYGGYLTILRRDGTPHGYDKYMWTHGRGAYIYAKLYNTVEKRSEWLEASKLGLDFLERFGINEANEAYFKVERDGTPLTSRPWTIFTESFYVLAHSEFSVAANDERHLGAANSLFWSIIERIENGSLCKSGFSHTQIYRDHATAMIMINTAQELRSANNGNERLQRYIDAWVHDEMYVYARDDQRVLFERIGVNGDPCLSEPEGRSITPGHGIESCWFCMTEGIYRSDRVLVDRSVEVLKWCMEIGWDEQFGGIYNFIDCNGEPPGHHDEGWGEDQDWDAKLFWVHSEALYALLLALVTTGDPEIREWYRKVHTWTFDHFPDPEYGEWFGYLHRDGTVSQTLKGTMKAFFHIPRALLQCMLLLEQSVAQ